MNEFLSILLGRPVDSSVIIQGFVGNTSYTAGCNINAQSVYSVSTGTVLAVDRDPKDSTWCVTVEVDSKHWIRYCHLSGSMVLVGRKLDVYTPIGYAYKNTMRLEYCTSDNTQFPVRILNKQLYKTDPTPIIFGNGALVR